VSLPFHTIRENPNAAMLLVKTVPTRTLATIISVLVKKVSNGSTVRALWKFSQ
jgi:hypothetical protein